jgi:hypothetical protein
MSAFVLMALAMLLVACNSVASGSGFGSVAITYITKYK